MASAPSDLDLAESLGGEVELSLDEMRSQVDSQLRIPAHSGKGKGRGALPTVSGSPSLDSTAPLDKGISPRGRGRAKGKSRGAASSLPTKGRPEPVRGGQQHQLRFIADHIQATEVPEAPEDDIATAHDLEEISVRSSKMEDEIDDLRTDLIASKARIGELEGEQSALVSRMTLLTRELDQIKEMVTHSSARGIPAISSPSTDRADKSIAVSSLAHRGQEIAPSASSGSALEVMEGPQPREVDTRSVFKKKKIT